MKNFEYKVGMTLTPWGTGCPGTVVKMDKNVYPPRWLKLRDEETLETHLITSEEFKWDEEDQ